MWGELGSYSGPAIHCLDDLGPDHLSPPNDHACIWIGSLWGPFSRFLWGMIKAFYKVAVFVTHMRGLINATSLPVHQHAGSLTCRRETHLVPWTWMKPRAFRAQIAMQAFRSDWCLCLKGSLISPEKAGRTKHARDLQFPNGGMWANGK